MFKNASHLPYGVRIREAAHQLDLVHVELRQEVVLCGLVEVDAPARTRLVDRERALLGVQVDVDADVLDGVVVVGRVARAEQDPAQRVGMR